MYRHSPVRNQRSKGLKTKHVVQLCLLLAVCFWLLFQLKSSHDKKNATISHDDQTLKFGRKDLHPKLDEAQIQMPDHTQQQQQEDEDEDEEEEEEEEQDEDKIEDVGGGGDDEIDEKSNMEIERDEVDIIDEDKGTEESEGEDNEDKHVETETETQTETESRVEDDGSTHEAREEHYKADDASSAVITHDPENEIQNGTLDDNNSSEDVGLVDNGTVLEEKDSESKNATENPNTTTVFDSNATVTKMTPNLIKNSGMLNLNDEENDSKSENWETNNPTHLEGRNELETMPEIETDTASE